MGKSALSSVIPHPFHRKSKDNDAAAPSAIPDVDPEPDHSEEEDLRDDGLSSDSSDEEHIASHQHQVGRKRSTMESTTSVAPAPIAINIASTPSSPEEQPLSRSPEKEAFGKLTVSQSEQGISSRVTSHRQAGVQSDTESSGLTSNKQPLSHKSSGQSYFDLSSSTGSGSGTATVPSTPGRRFPIRRATRDGSNSPAPSMSTQGGDTPGGNKRRPIFHRGKNKTGTQYNFAQSKDILGIVMLEICGATGLPKIKNSEWSLRRGREEAVVDGVTSNSFKDQLRHGPIRGHFIRQESLSNKSHSTFVSLYIPRPRTQADPLLLP